MSNGERLVQADTNRNQPANGENQIGSNRDHDNQHARPHVE